MHVIYYYESSIVWENKKYFIDEKVDSLYADALEKKEKKRKGMVVSAVSKVQGVVGMTEGRMAEGAKVDNKVGKKSSR